MKILLVSATHAEISAITGVRNVVEDKKLHETVFSEVKALVTGIGIPSTIYNLANHLFECQYDLVINAGICGAFSTALPLGSVVEVTNDCFADQLVETGNGVMSWNEAGLSENHSKPYVYGTLDATYPLIAGALTPVKGITSDTVHANLQTIDFLRNRYNPHVESMEGAAVFYVCAKTGTPCAQIRAVSNYVGIRDKSQWKIQLAVQNLAEALKQIVETCP